MRCERCKASCEEHYAESYECEWYCAVGVVEDGMNENSNGDWGCNLHYKIIEKRLNEIELALEKEREAFVRWYLESEEIR